jgi:hypothetical protein
MTFIKSPGVYVTEIEVNFKPTVMKTLEEIEQAITEACEQSLFKQNDELNRHYIQTLFESQLRDIYFNGFKICDYDGDPIDNVEDCKVEVTFDNYNAYAGFGPTAEYWNRKMEPNVRAYERLIDSIQANAAMEFFDPCI